MEPSTVDNNEIRNKIRQIYFLAIILILSSCIQWFLLSCFEFFEFLVSTWLLAAAFITAILIITILCFLSCMDKNLPKPLEWIFGILIAEIMVIVLGPMVMNAYDIVLYIALPVIIICMAILFTFGSKINEQHIPTLVVVIFFCNLLIFVLILILMIIWKFFVQLYAVSFFIVLSVAIPILFMNVIYVSMLIGYNHIEPKTLTDCLKPALYMFTIFVALVWFSLESEIQLA